MIRYRCRALLAALTLDALLAELPNAVHPVVLMGRFLALGERLAPAHQCARFVWGAAWVGSGMGLSAHIAAWVPRHPVVQGMAAHTLLAYRALDRAVGEVQASLIDDDLLEARRLLGWHLVSRLTENLGEAEVAAAAIESLAENLSDSVIAPGMWYLLGGLPALAAYRFANTADAMWGYHNERYEWLGKAAARLDDLLNWMPARLTAMLVSTAVQIVAGRGAQAWHVARRDHGRTASPNAGWPMAALAGALDTMLVKIDHYWLGDGPCRPDPVMIGKARHIARTVLRLVVAALIAGSLRRRDQTV